MEKEADMAAGSFSFITQSGLQGHHGMITHHSMALMVFIIMMGIYTGKCWHVPQGKVPFCYLSKLDPYGGGVPWVKYLPESHVVFHQTGDLPSRLFESLCLNAYLVLLGEALSGLPEAKL